MNSNGMLSSAYTDDWRWNLEECLVLSEIRNTKCSGHDDHPKRFCAVFSFSPEFLSKLDHAGQRTNQHVGIDASLVGFVDDDYAVAGQKEVVRQLSEQYTVGHELDTCSRRGGSIVTDLVRDS